VKDIERAFYQKLKMEPCIVCHKYGVDAAHLKPLGKELGVLGEANRKWTVRSHKGPRGFFAVPLCREHHDYIHRKGEDALYTELGVDKGYAYAYALRLLAEVAHENCE